eukprot:TRINITY_DN67445_c5_g1_i2.p1 TRINITY_DN67445_c5_g1~~TRINITY_DN67445_c5_g1_i2.p1  ORF type:complete len:1621 (-),score=806.77 TRINITY_DN67445_c5_g1_i2:178-4539(-)
MTGGSWQVIDGVLNLHPGVTFPEPTTVFVRGGSMFVVDGAEFVTIPHTEQSGGLVQVDGHFASSADYKMTEGTLDAVQEMTCVDAQHLGGVMTGAGTITCDGQFDWTDGPWSGTGSTTLNGPLNMASAALKHITDRDVTTAADIQWQDGDIQTSGSVLWTHLPTGTFYVVGELDWLSDSTEDKLVLQGDLVKTVESTQSILGIFMESTSNVLAQEGVLHLQGSLECNSGGSVGAAAAATARFEQGLYNLNTGCHLTGAGAIEVDSVDSSVHVFDDTTMAAGAHVDVMSGSVTVYDGVSFSENAPVNVKGGLLSIEDGAAVTVPELALESGRNDINGSLTVTDTWSCASGTTSIINGASASVETGANFDLAGAACAVQGHGDVRVAGSMTWSDGVFARASEDDTSAGLLTVEEGGVMTLAGSGASKSIEYWSLVNKHQVNMVQADVGCDNCHINNSALGLWTIEGSSQIIDHGNAVFENEGAVVVKDHVAEVATATDHADVPEDTEVIVYTSYTSYPNSTLLVDSATVRFAGPGDSRGITTVTSDGLVEFTYELHTMHDTSVTTGAGQLVVLSGAVLDFYGYMSMAESGAFVVQAWNATMNVYEPAYVDGTIKVDSGHLVFHETAGNATIRASRVTLNGGDALIVQGSTVEIMDRVAVYNARLTVEGLMVILSNSWFTVNGLAEQGNLVNGTGQITVRDDGEMEWFTGKIFNEDACVGTILVEAVGTHHIYSGEPPLLFGGWLFVSFGRHKWQENVVLCDQCCFNETDDLVNYNQTIVSGVLNYTQEEDQKRFETFPSVCEFEYYGEKCKCYIPGNLTASSLPLQLDVEQSRVDSDTLYIVFDESVKYVNMTLRPPNEACMPNFTYSSIENEEACQRKWTAAISWNAAYDPDGVTGCGFTRVESNDGLFIEFHIDMEVENDELLPPVRGEQPQRRVVHKLPFIVRFPKQVEVTTGEVEIFAPVRTLAVISDQHVERVDDETVLATVTLFTSLQWPFYLSDPTWVSAPDGMQGEQIVDSQDATLACPDTTNVPCEVKWQLPITPGSDNCTVSGLYSVRFAINCQDSRSTSCPLDAATDEVIVSFRLDSSDHCAQVADEVGLNLLLQSYEDAAHTVTKDDFIDPQTVYFTVGTKADKVSIQETIVSDVVIVRSYGTPELVLMQDRVNTALGDAVSLATTNGPAAQFNVRSWGALQFNVVYEELEMIVDERMIVNVRVTVDVIYQNAGQDADSDDHALQGDVAHDEQQQQLSSSAKSLKMRTSSMVDDTAASAAAAADASDDVVQAVKKTSLTTQREIVIEAPRGSSTGRGADENDDSGLNSVSVGGATLGQVGAVSFGMVFVAILIWFAMSRARRGRRRAAQARAAQSQAQQAQLQRAAVSSTGTFGSIAGAAAAGVTPGVSPMSPSSSSSMSSMATMGRAESQQNMLFTVAEGHDDDSAGDAGNLTRAESQQNML